jgi:hypothetical protein
VKSLALLAVAACGRIDFDRYDARVATCTGNALVACWKLDGNTLDSAATALDATSSGLMFGAGRADDRAGVFGSATRVDIPETTALDITDALTVEGWIFADGFPNNTEFAFDNDNQYDIGIGGGHLSGAIVLASGARLPIGATPLTTGVWHHIALRFDGTTVDLVLDGVVDASLAAGGPILVGGSNGSRIGGDAGVLQVPPFIGAIDEVKIWRRALATNEL